MVRYDEEIHDWMDEIQEYDDRCDGWDDQDMICDVCMYLMLWLMFCAAVGFGGGTGQQRRAGGGVEEKWGVGE